MGESLRRQGAVIEKELVSAGGREIFIPWLGTSPDAIVNRTIIGDFGKVVKKLAN